MYEIIVCTPRHLQDLIKKEDHRDPLHPLYHLDTLVLDEADMLLDGSYFADVEKIVKTLKLIRRYKIQDNVIQVMNSRHSLYQFLTLIDLYLTLSLFGSDRKQIVQYSTSLPQPLSRRMD